MKALQRLSVLRGQLINQHTWHKNVFQSRSFSAANDNQSKLGKFNAGLHLRPHALKKHKGGEDAACLNDTMLGVADGVGGWAESGVDPANYSRRLCSL